MSAQTDRKLADCAQWFYHHYEPMKGMYDLNKRVEFLEKIVENLLYLQTYVVEDLQKVEGRKSLWTPGEVQMTGDLKRFG